MKRTSDKTGWRSATTLVELTVAMAMAMIALTAVVPLFASVRSGSDTRWATLDMIQNARVLNAHLGSHLAGARRIVAVSPNSGMNGYIELEGQDGAVSRYALGDDGYVAFGPRGHLSDLAGPVKSLKFTCYEANDLAHPTVEPASIRFVTWQAILKSTGSLAGDKTVTGACYLRVSPSGAPEQIRHSYDFTTGRPGVDIFAFAGEGKPRVPKNRDKPTVLLDAQDGDALEADDGHLHVVEVSSNANYGQIRFVVRIDEEEDDVAEIAVTWNGKGVNGHQQRQDGAALHIWNYRSSSYDCLAVSSGTDVDITLSGIRQESISDYLGGAEDDTIVLIVVSNDKKTGNRSNRLFTDYVRVDIRATAGGSAVAP